MFMKSTETNRVCSGRGRFPSRTRAGVQEMNSISLLALIGLYSAPAFSQPPNPPQWIQTFNEEFEGHDLDRHKWGTAYTYGGRADSELYVIENGKLKLRLEKDLPKARVSHADNWRSFAQKYGWFEIRAKTARPTVGTHAAFWLIPWDSRYNNLTRYGVDGSRSSFDEAFEIDIFELPGNNPAGGLFSVFWGKNVSGHLSQFSFRKNFGAMDLSQDFHDYALDWEPDRITWYLDGKEITHVDGHSPTVPFYVMLDHYAGAWIPMDPNAQHPLDFEIQWVKAYQKSARLLAPSMITGCDGFLSGSSGTTIHAGLDNQSLTAGGLISIQNSQSGIDQKLSINLILHSVRNDPRPKMFSETISANGTYSTGLQQGSFTFAIESNMMVIALDPGLPNSRNLRLVCH
jgi:beta-glucanase (GH16 family)